jgi:hypothetical protein
MFMFDQAFISTPRVNIERMKMMIFLPFNKNSRIKIMPRILIYIDDDYSLTCKQEIKTLRYRYDCGVKC